MKLYLMNTRILDDPEVFADYYACMSEKRQRKTDRMHFEKDKRLSLGAGILIDLGLKDYGLRERTARIQTGENGKPYLADDPQIHFNVSHSEQMVLAAFDSVEVGCDIEYMAPLEPGLAKRFFCPPEYEYITGQKSKAGQTEAFYRMWTLKESFLKATGLGMALPLDAFCIRVGDEISVEQQTDGAEYGFCEYTYDAYKAAVCRQGFPSFVMPAMLM